MKNFALIAALAAGIITTAISSQAADRWLRVGWAYADSKEDMEKAVSFAVDDDKQAWGFMVLQNKISSPNETERQVFLTDVPFFSGLVGFRFKGSTTTYWTNMEAISDVATPVTAERPAAPAPIAAGSMETVQELQIDRAEYKKNVKSGKWKEFKNGE